MIFRILGAFVLSSTLCANLCAKADITVSIKAGDETLALTLPSSQDGTYIFALAEDSSGQFPHIKIYPSINDEDQLENAVLKDLSKYRTCVTYNAGGTREITTCGIKGLHADSFCTENDLCGDQYIGKIGDKEENTEFLVSTFVGAKNGYAVFSTYDFEEGDYDQEERDRIFARHREILERLKFGEVAK